MPLLGKYILSILSLDIVIWELDLTSYSLTSILYDTLLTSVIWEHLISPIDVFLFCYGVTTSKKLLTIFDVLLLPYPNSSDFFENIPIKIGKIHDCFFLSIRQAIPPLLSIRQVIPPLLFSCFTLFPFMSKYSK